MKLKTIAAIVLCLTVGGSMSGGVRSANQLKDLLNGKPGNYQVYGKCLTNKGSGSFTLESGGALRVYSQKNCRGQYGKAKINKVGNQYTLVSFNSIDRVEATYRARTIKQLPGRKVAILEDGRQITLDSSTRGRSKTIIKLVDGGYIQQ